MISYEFLQTAKKLTGTEVLILKSNYEIVQGKTSESLLGINFKSMGTSRESWRSVVARQMGYGDLNSVVAKYEANLESLGLIAPRQEMNSMQGEFHSNGAKYRLTMMGQKFCEFITKYE